MMILKRRERPRMGSRAPSQIRCSAHLRWVRGRECAATSKDSPCSDWSPMEAAHVRTETDGGIGIKPGDCYAIPLCAFHHRQQHLIGEAAFERRYNISMKEIASDAWRQSPAGIRYRRDHEVKE